MSAPDEPQRPVQVIVRCGESETMVRLTLAEAGNLVIDPINAAVGDSEAGRDLQASDPARFRMIGHWANGLYWVTA